MITLSHRLFAFLFFGFIFIFQTSFAQDADFETEQFRSRAKIYTVAKIINFTEGLEEGGSDSSFWYALDPKACIYRKAGLSEAQV